MKAKLLFVTQVSERTEEGIDYALELARSMKTGMDILLLQKESLSSSCEKFFSSIAFAEEGEQGTALEMLEDSPDEKLKTLGTKGVLDLRKKCEKAGVETSLTLQTGDPLDRIADFIKDKQSIEMILLSPSLSEEKGIRKILKQKLLKKIDRPIVTIRRLQESTS